MPADAVHRDHARGPAAVRYPRGTGPGVEIQEAMRALPVGRGVVLREGRSGLALLAFGSLVADAERIGERTRCHRGQHALCQTDRPGIDSAKCGQERTSVTLEENVVAGGAGSARGRSTGHLGGMRCPAAYRYSGPSPSSMARGMTASPDAGLDLAPVQSRRRSTPGGGPGLPAADAACRGCWSLRS